MPDDRGKEVAKMICLVATATLVAFVPPVGVAVTMFQVTAAAGAQIAIHHTENEEAKEVLGVVRDIYLAGAEGATMV